MIFVQNSDFDCNQLSNLDHKQVFNPLTFHDSLKYDDVMLLLIYLWALYSENIEMKSDRLILMHTLFIHLVERRETSNWLI